MSDQAPKILKLVILMTGTLWGIVLSSCSEKADPQSESLSSNLGVFDLSTNTFEVCKSKKSGKETFLSFFSKGGYSVPGNPGVDTLTKFFEEIRAGYSQETDDLNYSIIKREYHTFTHAMDVMIATHSLLQNGAAVFLKPEERSVLLLAALGHDVLHTGVNNGFLTNAKHSLIEEFGEQGVQEKRSAQYLHEMLNTHGILQKPEFKRYAKFIRESILWTDFSKHKELMNKIDAIIPKIVKILERERQSRGLTHLGGSSPIDLKEGMDLSGEIDAEERLLLASFLLHCADVSNPGKEWPIAEKWANLVMNEFFAQGDLEKSLGMEPSMNCDRLTVKVPQCQIGFAKYVVHDLYSKLAKIVPQGGEFLLTNLAINQAKWQSILDGQKNP